MTQTTEEILQARGLRNGIPGPHGEWQDNAVTGQSLKVVVRKALEKRREDGVYPQLAAIHLEALDMFCLKIARIATGDANEPDHWQDIEGYAKLCRERLGLTVAQVRAREAQTSGGSGARTGVAAPAAASAPAPASTRPVAAPVAERGHRTEEQEKRFDELSSFNAVRLLSENEAREFKALQELRPIKRAWGDILRSTDSPTTI